MPINIRYIEDQPIIIVELSGHVVPADLEAAYSATIDLIEQQDLQHVYRITDVRQANSDFGEMMKILAAAKNLPGSSVDPRVHVVFVGSNIWAQLARDFLTRQSIGAGAMPIYLDIDEAFEYISVLRHRYESSSA